MSVSDDSLADEGHRLRGVASPGSTTYRLAFVLYVAAMIIFFGNLGQALLMLAQLQLLPAIAYGAGGFAGWWICAGIAIGLGVNPREFFARLETFLER
jgi:hypothetical protein